MSDGRIARRAYAKVNLALSVGPPLPAPSPHAGMHPIASWMHAIDLWDEVSVWRTAPGAPSGAARCLVGWAHGAPRPSVIDWPGEADLAARAVGVLERETGRALPVSIQIVKRIPVGGGFGGGSSDAAAALLATNTLFGLGLSAERLRELSRQLGSDVAYFIDEANGGPADAPPRPALVTWMGDRIERTARAAGELLLILPPFGCPTGAVYRAYDALGPRPLREAEVRALATGRVEGVNGSSLFNDLAPAAERVQPLLADIRARAERAARPGRVCMSGSGSTLFVPFPGEEGGRGDGAASIARKLRANLPDCVIWSSRCV